MFSVTGVRCHATTCVIPRPTILDGLMNLIVGELHRGHKIDRRLNHVSALVDQVMALLCGLSVLVPVLERLHYTLLEMFMDLGI